MPRKTKLLANTLKAAKNEHDLSRYLDDLDQDESWIGFQDYYFSIPKVREQKVADIIVHSGLDRTYAYQILSYFIGETAVKELQVKMQYAHLMSK